MDSGSEKKFKFLKISDDGAVDESYKNVTESGFSHIGW
jgi:hypothetical protein